MQGEKVRPAGHRAKPPVCSLGLKHQAAFGLLVVCWSLLTSGFESMRAARFRKHTGFSLHSHLN